jgi:hypothetical protein
MQGNAMLHGLVTNILHTASITSLNSTHTYQPTMQGNACFTVKSHTMYITALNNTHAYQPTVQGNAMLHGQVTDAGDGVYHARYLSTKSGRFQTFLGLHNAGGLSATYYSDILCGKPVLVRQDFSVNFDWGLYSPHPDVPVDDFCVRWGGWVRPPAAGVYTFLVTSDDSAKLWVDHDVLLDQVCMCVYVCVSTYIQYMCVW